MQKIAVTLPEATELSGIGRSSLYKLFNEGKLKPRKSGKRTLILVSELERVPEWSFPSRRVFPWRLKRKPRRHWQVPSGVVLSKQLRLFPDNARGYRTDGLSFQAAYVAQRYRAVAMHGAAGLPARPDWREARHEAPLRKPTQRHRHEQVHAPYRPYAQ
jgi:hypothetical protein